MWASMNWVCFCFLLMPLPSANRQLQRLVIIARHSVKNPYPGDAKRWEPGVIDLPVSAYTSRTLPEFQEAPGELTSQGRLLMRHLGTYFHSHYAGFLAHIPCGGITVYADPVSHRCVSSAEAFAHTLFGPTGCPIAVNPGAAGDARKSHEQLVRLFRDQPDVWDTSRGCSTPPSSDLTAMLGESHSVDELLAPWLRVYRRQLGVVQEKTECCKEEACVSKSGYGLCTLFSLPTVLASNVTWRAVGGALGVGSAFAEMFAMQYCNGMDAGWGLQEQEVAELLSLLEVPLLQAGMNDVSVRNLGAELLSELLAALEPSGSTAESPSVTVYYGHDTNLHFLQRLLGLKWFSEGWWPNIVEPGAQLVFEVYNEVQSSSNSGKSAAAQTVRVLKVAATPKQQHTAVPLTLNGPPSIVPLWVPGCDGIYCSLPRLVSIANAVLRPSCVRGSFTSSSEPPARGSAPESGGQKGSSEDAAPPAAATPSTSVPHDTAKAAPTSPAAYSAGKVGQGVEKLHQVPPAPLPAASPIVAPEKPGDGSSNKGFLFFVILCVVLFLIWRYVRKKQAAARGYEVLGSSGSPGFTL
mmetsp:Transcript_6291/g.10586  ORF Transcript_6291/g.10586 Transcript_6291/m.10586 type:complete len:579 (+) Transcript_6291:116-1852(+)